MLLALALTIARALGADAAAAASAPGASGVEAAAGPPTPAARIDKTEIEKVILGNMAQVKQCYQPALKERPDLAGKVVVKFVIARDGTVSSAITTASSLGDPEVESCVADTFLGFTFDQPPGGGVVVVNYPSIFVPFGASVVYPAHATIIAPSEGTSVGTLDIAAINAVVKRRSTLRALARCRAARPRDTSSVSGEIVVRFVISERGDVASAVTESTTVKAPDIEACVTGVMGRLRFPRPEGEGVVVVSYPLIVSNPGDG